MAEPAVGRQQARLAFTVAGSIRRKNTSGGILVHQFLSDLNL
jgi:hypothetical protein